jgi:hypothetical protein
VWEGGFDEAAWGAAGGLSEFSVAAPINRRQISKQSLSQATAIGEERLE